MYGNIEGSDVSLGTLYTIPALRTENLAGLVGHNLFRVAVATAAPARKPEIEATSLLGTG